MLARVALYAAYIIFVINIQVWVGRSTGNVIEKGLFLAAALILMMTRPFRISIIIILFIAIVLVFVLGLLTNYPYFSWETLILSLNQFLIVYAMLAVRPTNKDVDGFLKISAWLPILSVIIGTLYQYLGLSQLWYTEYSSGVSRLNGSYIPAFLSGMAMCGMFASLQLSILAGKPTYYAVLVIDIIILALAGGRAPMVIAFVVCAFGLVASPVISSKAKVLGSLIGALALLVLSLILGGPIFKRFMESGDNGRILIAEYLQQFLDKYPYTGIGFGHQYLTVPHEILVRTSTVAAHNDFLRLAVELGYGGMFLFYLLLTIAVFIRSKRSSGGIDYITIVSYFGILFISRTDNVLANPCFIGLVVISAMAGERFDRSYKNNTSPKRYRSISIDYSRKKDI